jgi:hypothetical protein
MRDCLRLDFDFRCVYCLSAEGEVGPLARYGGFEVEHFKPKSKFRELRHAYRNLLWACAECNRAKGGRWPTPELRAAGNFFVDPTLAGLGKHLELDGTSSVGYKTQAGWYMIQQLNLNSELHRRRRATRHENLKKYALVTSVVEAQQRRIDGLAASGVDVGVERQLLEARKADLKRIEAALRPDAPHDAPTVCVACNPGKPRVDRFAQLEP